jgi:GMP synthase (glutamine-hydrolysing) B subunit
MAELTVHRYRYDVPESLSDFNPQAFIDGAIKEMAGLVGRNERVALSASGGVDSTTVAFLLKKALGERLHLFFIDDGLRRIIDGKEEHEVTAQIFKGFPHFEVLHTRNLILPWFEGVADGSLKRDMFRGLYVVTSNRHIASLAADWIADGTIAPDIVMTDEKRQIQHNVNLPYSMKKLEPLAPLYKPHVRKVAMHLGIPRDFATRIPCPGPAQLLRVGGRFSEEKLLASKRATDVVESLVQQYGVKKWGKACRYDESTGVRTPFQYFATCLDSEMEKDASLSMLAAETLGGRAEAFRMADQAMWIDASVSSQERRLYAPIVWVRGPAADPEALTRLADAVYRGARLPRVLYEVHSSGKPGYRSGIKVVESEDVRTAWPMPIELDELTRMGKAVCEVPGICAAAYDISRRPPATIELF